MVSAFFCVWATPVTAQNLVENPGFEQYNNCVYRFNSRSLLPIIEEYPFTPGYRPGTGAPGWSSVRPCRTVMHLLPCHRNAWVRQTPLVVRDSSWYIPHSGNSYIVLQTYDPSYFNDGRSYAQGTLRRPLRAGCTYRVSLWARISAIIGDIVFSLAPTSTDNLGIHFTERLSGVTSNPRTGGGPPLLRPAQVNLLPSGTLLTDTVMYTKLSGTFVAQGGEQYFTLGNFEPDASTTVRRLRPSGYPPVARLALDDVSVEAVPPAGLLPLLGPAPVLGACAGSGPAALTAAPGFGAYRWNTGQTTRSIPLTQPGRYVVTADFGCGTVQDSVEVRRYSPTQTPLLGLAAPPAPLCPGQTLALSALPGFTDYRWADGATGATRTFGQPGRYRLSARTADGCLVRDSVTISILPPPFVPAYLPADTLVCEQAPLRLTVPAPAPGTTYSWGPDRVGPTLTVPAGGSGSFTLTARTRCEARTATVRVRTQDCASLLQVPNVVTPNSDGLNDVFRVIAPSPRPLRLQVFDRWGRQVFQRENYQREWPDEPRPPAGVYHDLLTDDAYGRRYRGWVEVVY